MKSISKSFIPIASTTLHWRWRPEQETRELLNWKNNAMGGAWPQRYEPISDTECLTTYLACWGWGYIEEAPQEECSSLEEAMLRVEQWAIALGYNIQESVWGGIAP